MTLSVGCTLGYQVLAAPTAAFTFNVLANSDAQQRVVREEIVCTPPVPTEIVEGAKGGRVLRGEVPTGAFEFRYRADVEVSRPALPAVVKADNPGRLPLSILTYTLPSRYCESDRFSQIAWELFGKTVDRGEQVRAVCAWIDGNLAYAPGRPTRAPRRGTCGWDARAYAATTRTSRSRFAARSRFQRAMSAVTRWDWSRWIFTRVLRRGSAGSGGSSIRRTTSCRKISR